MVFVLFWMMYSAKKDRNSHDPLVEESISELPDVFPLPLSIFWTIVGLLLLLVSSNLLVYGATNIASSFGVSDLVIGLTIVAIGTSLPELAATISSARKGETDLAVGNIVGSNLFNTLTVLPIPALVQPLKIPDGVLERDIWVMLGATVILYIVCFGVSKSSRYKITRLSGAFLLALFIAYEALLYIQST
ncbi:UNVERIFIED_CONTAM: hypothetical protein GTU68_013403 [Idotea baltica]|nr:hypothetical protein [Idotea baltica]